MPGGVMGGKGGALPGGPCPYHYSPHSALAMKHLDLKQMELDTAAAKVDELTKQLESLWSDSPPPPGSQAGAPLRVSLLALLPTLAPKASSFHLHFRQGCQVLLWRL